MGVAAAMAPNSVVSGTRVLWGWMMVSLTSRMLVHGLYYSVTVQLECVWRRQHPRGCVRVGTICNRQMGCQMGGVTHR
jgi:hypothetical protein